jgi:hypothetical protein
LTTNGWITSFEKLFRRPPNGDARLAGWRRIAFDMPDHASQKKTKDRKEEVIWINR